MTEMLKSSERRTSAPKNATRPEGKTLPPKLLYARKDVAHVLSISLRSVDHLIANGKLKTRKLGNRIMVTWAELSRFADNDHDTLTSVHSSVVAA